MYCVLGGWMYYLFTMYVSGTHSNQKWFSPLDLWLQVVMPCGWWESNPGPLLGWHVILPTDPSLALLFGYHLCMYAHCGELALSFPRRTQELYSCHEGHNGSGLHQLSLHWLLLFLMRHGSCCRLQRYMKRKLELVEI